MLLPCPAGGVAVGGSSGAKAYTAKVTNSWLLGGPKYTQYRSWLDFAEQSGCMQHVMQVLPSPSFTFLHPLFHCFCWVLRIRPVFSPLYSCPLPSWSRTQS